MLQDPVIKRIRETRHKISEMFDHNPKKYIDFLKQQEKQHSEKLATQLQTKQTKEGQRPLKA
jgi:hypothetical protein